MSSIDGGRLSTTLYSTLFDAVLPALSVASTVNVFSPALEVSMAEPAATVPVQVSTPEPPGSSPQA